jgi:cytochrome P450
MFLKKRFENSLENIRNIPEKEFRFSILGLFKRTVTANADTITQVLSSGDYVRCALSRRIVHHVGARHSMVSQLDDRAFVKRDISMKYFSNPKIMENIYNTAIQHIVNDITAKSEVEIYSVIYDHLSSAMVNELLGIDFSPADAEIRAHRKKHYVVHSTVSLPRLLFLNLVPLPMFVKNWFTPGLKKINDLAEENVTFIYNRAVCRPQSLLTDLKTAEQKGVLSHKEVLGEIRAVGIGAHTLTISLMWTLYLLSHHADHKQQVRDDDRHARYVYYESLRLLPPFFVISKEKKASRCPYHNLLPKERVTISIASVHRMPDYWESPDHFYPERFAQGLASIKKGAFVPFGMGERSCPGAALSMRIGPRIVQELTKQFDLTLAQEPVIKRRVELMPEDNKMFFRVQKLNAKT